MAGSGWDVARSFQDAAQLNITGGDVFGFGEFGELGDEQVNPRDGFTFQPQGDRFTDCGGEFFCGVGHFGAFRLTYRRSAATRTAETVVPSAAAASFAVCQRSSGIRTFRSGVCMSLTVPTAVPTAQALIRSNS